MVTVKTKIRLGTIFLFVLVTLLGAFSIYYITLLRIQSNSILKANYESLEYAHNMQKSLDSIVNEKVAFTYFDSTLTKQESNITEQGEKAATLNLRKSFERLRNGDSAAVSAIRGDLQQILSLNMQAIKKKNEKTELVADNATSLLVAIASLIFIITFTFVINFPSVITNPIRRLTEAIKEIGQKNYSHRIHLESKDEFGKLADAFNEMAERLQYFESSNLNKLLFEKSRAEAVINSLKDATIGIDKDNKVLFANSQALQLLGIHTEDIVGKPAEEVAKKNDLFNYLVNNESTSPFKIVLNNRENYFTKEMVDVDTNKVIIIKNVTSFKELDMAKTNFIATISHELKTPIASSDFSLKLLDDERTGTLNTEQKELVDNIRQDNQRILKILSELLNMSQVEAGRIQLNVQKVNPSVVVRNAIMTVAASAKNKDIELVEHIPEKLPQINVDAEKTTWVLNNFLTNAIKYSSGGSSIHIEVKQVDHSIIFSVKDNGPGIAKEYQPRLFERYFQVPGSKSKGSGLGLAISKDFIEAEGGKIWVESDVGQGAKFSFELPLNNGKNQAVQLSTT